MGRWVRKILYGFLTLLVLALLGGFTYEQVGRARDASQLSPRVGQAVDIGGRTLNLYCSGQGSPTVFLNREAIRPVMIGWCYSPKWQGSLAPAGTTARV